jgi:hypothetical protein
MLFRKSSTGSIPQYVNLYEACFPGNAHLRSDYLSWLYSKNPVGSFIGADAFLGDAAVGQVAAIPCEYMLHGRLAKGLLALNVAVHPDLQGHRLFSKLGLQMCEFGHEAGYEFVIGVANAAATPGWVRHMGFQLIGPLEARIGVGPLGIDSNAAAQHAEFERSWSPETLAWRCANPRNPIFCRRSAGRVLCYAQAKGKLLHAYAELPPNSVPEMEWTGDAFLSPWRLYLGLVPGMACKFRRYLSIPRRLRPSPLNLVYRSLTERCEKPRKSGISFSFLDFDAY